MQQNYNIDPKNYVNIIYKEETESDGWEIATLLFMVSFIGAMAMYMRKMLLGKYDKFGKSIARLINPNEIKVRFK